MLRLRRDFPMLLAGILLLTPHVIAQQISGDFVVAGKVVDSVTGGPVSQALVTLSFSPIGGSGDRVALPSLRVLTTSAGEFRFERLPAYEYYLQAEKPGSRLFSSPPAEIKASIENRIVKLEPLGIIEGTVTNGDGEPVEGAVVEALASRVLNGVLELAQLRSVRTDDRGKYRMWNFDPGNYYLRVAGLHGGISSYVGAKAPATRNRDSFVPRYFGGADAVSGAAPIEIVPGRTATANVVVDMVPSFVVRGTLSNMTPYPKLSFQLFRDGERSTDARVAVHSTRGLLEIHDVVPGTYWIRVIQQGAQDKLIGDARVTVENADVDHLAIALLPLSAMKLSLQCPDCSREEEKRLRLSSLCLNPAEPRAARACSNSRMGLAEISPGDYSVSWNGFGEYVESLMVGNQNLLLDRRLHVESGALLPELRVTLGKDGGEIVASKSVTASPENVVLVAVPEFSTAAGPEEIVSLKGTTLRQRFQPGQYTVYAVQRDVQYRDPEVLLQLQHGIRVTVEPNGRHEITVTEMAR